MQFISCWNELSLSPLLFAASPPPPSKRIPFPFPRPTSHTLQKKTLPVKLWPHAASPSPCMEQLRACCQLSPPSGWHGNIPSFIPLLPSWKDTEQPQRAEGASRAGRGGLRMEKEHNDRLASSINLLRISKAPLLSIARRTKLNSEHFKIWKYILRDLTAVQPHVAESCFPMLNLFIPVKQMLPLPLS